MTRFLLAAGVAALAIAAPAASKPDDRGGGRDHDRGSQVQKAERGGGQARAQRMERRAERPQRAERRAERVQRLERRGDRVERRAARVERPERAERLERRADRLERRVQRIGRDDRIERRAERIDLRGNGRVAEREAKAAERALDRRDRQLDRMAESGGIKVDRIRDVRERRLALLAERDEIRLKDWDDLARGGVWLNGCPPGLAKKPVACVPPGQVKNLVGQRISALDDRVRLLELPDRLRYVYPDTDDYYHRYGNGYVYRVDRDNDLVSALLPLFGLGLTVGQPFPTSYPNYYMPAGLQSFYPDTPYTSYRYANGYMYEVDPYTGLIEDVDPLLGYGYGYGQMMPVTYSAYNVPYQYRSLYYDTPDHYYRYAPGAIYQVDPTTSLITAVAALLTNGLTVGQPLPTGYGVYNVPYDYRTTYYDTPDAWYRYSNGHIYRVDPTTQLVTAIVASVLT